MILARRKETGRYEALDVENVGKIDPNGAWDHVITVFPGLPRTDGDVMDARGGIDRSVIVTEYRVPRPAWAEVTS